MRFVLECQYCNRVINEFIDKSYGADISYKRMATCNDCGENIRKLEGNVNELSSNK